MTGGHDAGIGGAGQGSGGGGTPTGGASPSSGGQAGIASGGRGSGGVAGAAGRGPQGGGSGGGGVSGTGGSAGRGTGGAPGGTGGAASGGRGTGGGGGGAVGGAGGATACQQVGVLDRSCATDDDCLAVVHTTNCCGAAVWLGIRMTELQSFAALEHICDAGYPACGCASGPPTTDDGSVVSRSSTASVSCQGGICKTFATACGQPCATGRSCLGCGTQDAGLSLCSLRCTADSGCTEPGYPKCQFGLGTSGMGICVSSTFACF
jgi:hypothetical protein